MNLPQESYPERNSQIIGLRRAGITPIEIHRRLKVSRGVVAGVLHRAGLTEEPKGRGFGAPESVKDAVRADRATGLTYEQLAAKHGITAISAWCWVNGRRSGGEGAPTRRRRVG